MALLLRNPDGTYVSTCAICERPLTEPIFATTHFISDSSDRLWRYSDAGMHWDCYASWKYQRRFANQYFEAALAWKSKNPYWAVVHKSDDYFITANPNLADPMADIDLRAIGPGFRVLIQDWTEWIGGGWQRACVHPLEVEAMIAVQDSVRQAVPDSETLLHVARQALAMARGA